MFLKLCFCLSEYCFFNSILEIFEIKKVISVKFYKYLFVFNVFYLSISVFFVTFSEFRFIFLFFLPIVLLFVLTFVLLKLQEQKFSICFLNFLDKIAIKMATGSSFSQSFEQLLPENESFVQQKLSKLYNSVYFSQQNNSDFKKYINKDAYYFYFCDLLQLQSNRQTYLLELRKNIRTQIKIRHRSGQICLQYRIQSLFALGLFFAFSFIGVCLWGWNHIKIVFYMCLLIQFLGVICTFYLGKMFKWKD